MSKLFRKFLGFILLLTTIGLATCQSLLKAEPGEIKPGTTSTSTSHR
jgi:hypothetical protein